MRLKTIGLVGIVVIVVAFVSAPIVYSPTTIYGGLNFQAHPSYPNWESLSCRAFGFGMFYGRTFFQFNDSYQFGCPSPTANLN